MIHNRPESSLTHVVEVHVLLAVFAGLIALTVVTVAVSYFDFGPINLMVALGVATIKAALVALWFMHLRYESGLHAFIFLVGVVFLGVFLIIAMFDSVQYYPNVQSWEQSTR
jgi:cytochrome c oxidase subunit 4